MRRISRIVLALCLTGPAAAGLVTFTNGDRLTGVVQKMANGKVSIETPYAPAPLEVDSSLVANVKTSAAASPTKADEAFWWQRTWENISVSADFDQNYSGLSSFNQFSWSSDIEYAGERWEGSWRIRSRFRLIPAGSSC